MSPIRFPRELSKNQLSERQGLQGIFRVGTIEWEQFRAVKPSPPIKNPLPRDFHVGIQVTR